MNRTLWFFALCCIAAGAAVFLLNCAAAQKALAPSPAPDLRADMVCYGSVDPGNLYCFGAASDCATARSLAGKADDPNLSQCKPATIEARIKSAAAPGQDAAP